MHRLHSSRVSLFIMLSLIPASQVAAQRLPSRYTDFARLSAGPLLPRLLPGTSTFTFTMYGAPGDPKPLRDIMEVMKRDRLGNGFDPVGGTPQTAGPISEMLAQAGWPAVFYSGGEMQIKGGRAVFGDDSLKALAPLRSGGLFSPVQLGEWGYYFHNLSCNEGWWRDVYGADFDKYKHLMKPAGLAGYDQKPTSKQECFDIIKDYFTSRKHDLTDHVISVTGHSHYEAYAGEWGADCIGLEVGENIAFTQSKFAFTRGASRQWERPWSVQISPWFGPAVTTSGPLHTDGGIMRGLDAGHSLSLYLRMWLHSWFAGAAMVTPENSIATSFEKPEAPWTLTPYGKLQARTFPFMLNHDRGIPFTPVAIVIDHLAGYNGYMDKPWGILEPTQGDRQLRDLFDFQLYPGADHIHARPDPANPEGSYLRPTPFGEIFDVQLTNVSEKTLSLYPVIVLAGDIVFTPDFLQTLKACLRNGSRVAISQVHHKQLGSQYAEIATCGHIESLEEWINPATGRSTAISDSRLSKFKELLPIEVSGDPVEYEINRTSAGWVIELINNRGVTKSGNTPAIVDPAAVAHVHLHPNFKTATAVFWKAATRHKGLRDLDITIGPGDSEFVEFTGKVRN